MFRSKPTFRTTLAALALLAGAAAPAARAAVGPAGADFPRSTSSAQLTHGQSMDVMRGLDQVRQGRVTKQQFMRFMEDLYDRMDQEQAARVAAQSWAGRHL